MFQNYGVCSHIMVTHREFFIKFVQFRFMSVFLSYFAQKSSLFGRSNDSECSIFDKKISREGSRDIWCMIISLIQGNSEQMIGSKIWLEEGVDVGGV